MNPVLANPAVHYSECHDIIQDIRVQLDILTYNAVKQTSPQHVMTLVKTLESS